MEENTRMSRLGKLLKNKMTNIAIVLFVMIVIASVFSPYFLDTYNLQSLVRDTAFMGIIALGQCCLLLIGEIDLSLGKIASLCGVVGGMLMVTAGINSHLAFAICIVLGGFLGCINGFIITGLNLNSLVVTIGMTGVYGGVNLVLTKGRAITSIPEDIYFLGQGTLFSVPIPFVAMLIIFVIVLLITRYTQFGRFMYAIGDSKEAAQILGIKVKRTKTIVYTLVGAFSAIAGMLMVARLGTAQPSIGENWPLNSIASSVMGGFALTGGIGNPFGALLGTGIIAVIQNMIVLFRVSPYWQTVVSGAVVVLAISFESISNMIAAKKRIKARANTA